MPEWDERDKLAKEKEVLGLLPLQPSAGRARRRRSPTYCSHTTTEAAALTHRTEVMLGGMLSAIKFAHTKNPKPGSPSRYAMFDLEDMAGIIRCILWPDQFVQLRRTGPARRHPRRRGAIDKRPGSEEANLIVNELIPLDDLAGRFTRGVVIRVLRGGARPARAWSNSTKSSAAIRATASCNWSSAWPTAPRALSCDEVPRRRSTPRCGPASTNCSARAISACCPPPIEAAMAEAAMAEAAMAEMATGEMATGEMAMGEMAMAVRGPDEIHRTR